MYVLLAISLFLLYCGIYKINFQDRNLRFLKVLMFSTSVECFLISVMEIRVLWLKRE